MENESELKSVRVDKNGPPMEIILSNSLKNLADELLDFFFLSFSHPFEKRFIIVPGDGLRDWLQHYFAHHEKLKIAAGFQVLSLNQALRVFFPQDRKSPSFLELSLTIEGKIYQRLEENFNDALHQYLAIDDQKKREKRVAALSDQLAHLFNQYGLHGAQFLPSWLEQEGWQQSLWQTLFSSYSYPLAINRSEALTPFKIALFGFHYLPPVYLSLFSSLNVRIYQLSACEHFWEDLCSDKERVFLKKEMRKKGVNQAIQEQMDGYLSHTHPLLANCSKLSREHLKALDAFSLITKEVYEPQELTSSLSRLKNDLLEINQAKYERDASLQIHSATSKLREIEILRDTLETLLHSNPHIEPKEILVLAPDIASYAPYIDLCFGSQDSAFAYRIEGLSLLSKSQVAQGIHSLLSLPEERFSLNAVMHLFSFSAFREKIGFSLEEAHQLERWFKTAEIRWGLQSWQEGINRLALGLAVLPDEEGVLADLLGNWPTPCVAHSSQDLLNRFLELFEGIEKDLIPLTDSLQMGAVQWLEYFIDLSTRYFESDQDPFLQELIAVCEGIEVEGFHWTYLSMKRCLSHISKKATGTFSSSYDLQRITFRNLNFGSGHPAKIIWILGLEEGAFPRPKERSSLDEMQKDYVPTSVDEGRALFLDLLLLAEEHFILSYQRVNPEDSKEQGPSLLIEELKPLFKEDIIHHHPDFSFDASYFSKNASVKKWHAKDFEAAKAHYSKEPAACAPFFSKAETAKEIKLVTLKQLSAFARDPIKFYFHQVLNIYLKNEDEEEEKEFLLSNLQRSLLRKASLKQPLPNVIRQFATQGKFPKGLLKDVAIQTICDEASDLKKTLKSFNLSSSDIFSVEFDPHCTSGERKENGDWRVPPLVVNGIEITGTLPDVSPAGLLFHGKKGVSDQVKSWPHFLIYLSICPQLGSAPTLLMTKEESQVGGSLEPTDALKKYLDYFIAAHQSPSPLMPEWATPLLLKDPDDFKRAVAQSINGNFSFDNPYLQWLKRRNALFDASAVFTTWVPLLRETFTEGLL